MSNILISGDNLHFKTKFLSNFLKEKKTILIHLNEFENEKSICATQIDFYNYFSQLSYDDLISVFDELFKIMNFSNLEFLDFIHYLNFLKNLPFKKEKLIDRIIEYSFAANFNRDLKKNLDNKNIDFNDFQLLLSQYAFLHEKTNKIESLLIQYLLVKNHISLENMINTNIFINIDTTINQDVILYLLIKIINKIFNKNKIDLIIIEKIKYFEDSSLLEIIHQVPSTMNTYFIFDDFFIHKNLLPNYSLFFDYYVFLKHSMKSSALISELFGDILVSKKTYTLDKERRLKSNSLKDRLFNTNKTEHYTTLAPVREPRIFKEEIAFMNDHLCLCYSKYTNSPLFIDWTSQFYYLENEIQLYIERKEENI